jgi:hypothetical protein
MSNESKPSWKDCEECEEMAVHGEPCDAHKAELESMAEMPDKDR